MSQPVARKGDSSTGEGPYPPRPNVEASGDVKVNGVGVIREGDKWAPHNGGPNGVHKGEIGYTKSGSGTVKANGKAIARIGDPLVDGDTVAAGSPNVFAG